MSLVPYECRDVALPGGTTTREGAAVTTLTSRFQSLEGNGLRGEGNDAMPVVKGVVEFKVIPLVSRDNPLTGESLCEVLVRLVPRPPHASEELSAKGVCLPLGGFPNDGTLTLSKEDFPPPEATTGAGGARR